MAECAQQLARNVNYEIPALKKQMKRCQKIQRVSLICCGGIPLNYLVVSDYPFSPSVLEYTVYGIGKGSTPPHWGGGGGGGGYCTLECLLVHVQVSEWIWLLLQVIAKYFSQFTSN